MNDYIETVRLNGLNFIIKHAVEKLDHPLFGQYEPALVLGAFRENIWAFSWLGNRIVPHLSFTHFIGTTPGGFIPFLSPSAGSRANLYFKRALAHRTDPATSFLLLGRACHLLIDMSCPVHVHRVIHLDDPYEWFVEGNADKLKSLGIVYPKEHFDEPSELLRNLSDFTRQFRPDTTTSYHGQLLRKYGFRKNLKRNEIEHQANSLVPLATGYLVRLFQLYLEKSRQPQ